jgi:predicted ATPase/class 3 adenylate cyclase
MADLPAGTVTFLFTDIEGSTRLLHTLGDRYADALAAHRRVLRATFAASDGVEVDTQGDAFFYAFARASDALAAAAAAQAALTGGPVRVRMGIHTGEPQQTAEGYVGLDVHTGARIAASAHGGQVVMSRRTRELAGTSVELTDLGEHRLKDLEQPLHLYQLGATEFPPLRSLNATNLPEPVSSFHGRSRELAEAAELLGGSRLLTITGAGGVGKTRFAIALAHAQRIAYPDGVWWVPLAVVLDHELVVGEVERAIGATVALAEFVGPRRMLIVLDNFEQVIDAAPALSPVLLMCPNLALLVTSRALLRLDGERGYELASLSDSESLTLFCERARLEPNEPVAELCARLEGLPLAIELAAARAKLLTAEQILERLSQRLDLFSGNRDVDARHATLRATITWSHELLDPAERRLFARFGLFAGGATFDALETVAGAEPDTCQSLVEKSLIRRIGERLWMLETIREFALEQLELAPDVDDLRERHARHYLAVAEAANLWDGAPGAPRYALAAAEQANFRAALGWAAASRRAELGLRLATALDDFWVLNDPFEGMRWFEQLLAEASDVSHAVLAPALKAYGGVVNPIGDDDLAEALYKRSVDEYRAYGDEAGAAGALVRLGHSAWYRGDLSRALALGQEGLAGTRRSGIAREEAQALGLLGEVEFELGNHDAGLDLMEQSAATAAGCEFYWWQARMLFRIGKRRRALGHTGEAEASALAGLRLAAGLDDRRRTVQLLDLLSVLAADRGDGERCGRLRGAVEAELSRRPISAWSMTDVPPDSVADGALAEGRLLSLERAVDHALH